MNSGARKPFSTSEADLLDDVVECGFGVMQKQRAPPQRDEQVIIQCGEGAPPLEVLFQPSLCGLVQGNETAFADEQRRTKPSAVTS
jgi:hypothetical protein